jgi:thiamine-monophosphate kinase
VIRDLPGASEGSALGPGVEFDWIRGIVRLLGDRAAGLGDDCGLIRLGDEVLALSTDVSVEQVHFRLDWISLQEVGWRAAAAALSDLAAEGAQPVGLLAAVTLPAAAGEPELLELMSGVGAAAEFACAPVLGGDLSSGPVWSLAITVVGRTRSPITRSGAQPGDRLWVTGALGGARAALESWRRNQKPPSEVRARFAHPVPRIAAGQWLARHGAHAMIDLSDGIAGDARHLAAASEVRMEIDLAALPLTDGVPAEAKRLGIPEGQFAAEAGEDYELLVALPSSFDGAAEFVRDCEIGLTRIGTVGKGSGVRFLSAGRELRLAGFDHFG